MKKAKAKIPHALALAALAFASAPLQLAAADPSLETLEPALAQRQDIVFYGSFDQYGSKAWTADWGIPWNNRIETCTHIPDNSPTGSALRVSYPTGGVGPQETGAQFPIVFRNATKAAGAYYQELHLRYYLKFEEDFDFVQGGKLPGLMGGGDSWTRSGGNQPVGNNGWTLRFMWRAGGELVIYAYVPPSANGKWGSETWGQDIETGFTATPGQWHCIEEYVHIGTPGHDDGQLKVWIDGIERIAIDDMRFWDVENDAGRIGGIYFSTFHGGNQPDWAPQHDSFAQFDSLVAATQRVGPVRP